MSIRFPHSLLAIVLLCLAADLASAGVTFTATTRSEKAGFDFGEMSNATVKGRAQGNNGQIEYLGNSGDAIPHGTVILTSDGAENSTFYDSVRKICVPWTGNAVVPSSGNQHSGPVKTITDLEIQHVTNESGPEIAGFATQHNAFKISYKSEFEVSGKTHVLETVLNEAYWTTEELSEPALRIWLDQGTWKSGNGDVDEEIAAALAAAAGVPLKRVSKLSVKSEGGRDLGTSLTLEVNSVESGDIPPNSFKAPFRCAKESSK